MIRTIQRSLGILTVGALSLMLSFCGGVYALDSVSPYNESVAPTTYDDWLHRYALTREQWSDILAPLLTVTQVEDEEEQRPGPFESPPKQGYRISVKGVSEWFFEGPRGAKGAGYPQIPDADLKRVNKMISALPKDGRRLPPPGRRLLVQAMLNDHFETRIYDRANMPDQILKLLHLCLFGIPSWVPEFKPASVWKFGERSHGALFLSPDEKQAIICETGRLKFWNLETHEMDREVLGPVREFEDATFSPDRSLVAFGGWGDVYVDVHVFDAHTWQQVRSFREPTIGRSQVALSSPRFTRDGRLLLLQTSEPSIRAYDTRTWQQKKLPSGIPADARAYVPAPRGNPALYLAKDESLILWDSSESTPIAKLDASVRLRQVAFSPRQSLVAAVTFRGGPKPEWNNYHIRVWNTKTGKLVRELKALERGKYERVDGLLWSPDGKYVMAAIRGGSIFSTMGIHVWSIASGRDRGEFIGCSGSVNGLALFDHGHKLVAGSVDGQIRVWDVDIAFEQIGALEKSFRKHARE